MVWRLAKDQILTLWGSQESKNLEGEIDKKDREPICLRFFRFSTVCFEIFRISFQKWS